MALKVVKVFTVLLAFFLALATGEVTTYSIHETIEVIIANGYPAERHHVETKDGYILEMHRIPRGRNDSSSSTRPVVFLMHGLLATSQSFVALGPRSAIAYNMADAGFDVWMGNARGNRLSRNHSSLNPNHSQERLQFFDFSFEEIAIIDVPAMVDYALEVTGQTQLHYIGHSQGGTVFLVLASMRKEYNDKFKSVHLLAGVGYQNHFPSRILSGLASNTHIIYRMALALGLVEMFPPIDRKTEQEAQARSAVDMCAGTADYAEICQLLGMSELLPSDDLASRLQIGGAAFKQVAHYGQNIRDKSFRQWDFGSTKNWVEYGQSIPPIYNLARITTQVTMHYTISDILLDERDVLAMAADMPNTNVRRVARNTFLHSDFVAADDNKELVTDYIIDAILELELEQEYEQKPNAAQQVTDNQVLRTCLCLFLIKLFI